jgi:hypothetical protein
VYWLASLLKFRISKTISRHCSRSAAGPRIYLKLMICIRASKRWWENGILLFKTYLHRSKSLTTVQPCLSQSRTRVKTSHLRRSALPSTASNLRTTLRLRRLVWLKPCTDLRTNNDSWRRTESQTRPSARLSCTEWMKETTGCWRRANRRQSDYLFKIKK